MREAQISETLLSLEGVETRYGDSQVLFGVTLDVHGGEVVTLLGRNGMGKTTTVLVTARNEKGLPLPKALE